MIRTYAIAKIKLLDNSSVSNFSQCKLYNTIFKYDLKYAQLHDNT